MTGSIGHELFELFDRESDASTDANGEELLAPDELVDRRSADRQNDRGLGDVDEERALHDVMLRAVDGW